jgi:hypothetical protein
MASALITGANRGIGLKFARQHAAESVDAMRDIIGGLTKTNSGKFFNHTGKEFLW